jgi:hypothetical protein
VCDRKSVVTGLEVPPAIQKLRRFTMNFLSHQSDSESQWQAYQRLELIPDSVSQPTLAATTPTWGLGWLWRGLLHLLMDELVVEQQVEYLERCWYHNASEQKHDSRNTLQRLWVLME